MDAIVARNSNTGVARNLDAIVARNSNTGVARNLNTGVARNSNAIVACNKIQAGGHILVNENLRHVGAFCLNGAILQHGM